MRVIGIDPGSRYTGYGIVEQQGGRLHHIASGRINVSRTTDFSQRLVLIYEGLTQVFREHEVSDAALESLFVARNVQSTIKLSQARGVALLAIEHAGCQLREYVPTKIKQAVTGYGHASKDHVRLIVAETLHLSLKTLSEDAADALAMAICHARMLEFEDKMIDGSPFPFDTIPSKITSPRVVENHIILKQNN